MKSLPRTPFNTFCTLLYWIWVEWAGGTAYSF